MTQSGHRVRDMLLSGLNGQMADHSNQTHPLYPEDRGRHQPNSNWEASVTLYGRRSTKRGLR